MSTARTITITLAAVAMLGVSACEKQATTTPTDATEATDADETDEVDTPSDEADEADEADEDSGAVALNKATFDETISEHFSEVSDCYVASLEGNPDLKGKLDADFTIGADGKVTNITAADGSTLNDEGLLACINSAASSWTFGIPSKGEMTLRYTFNLAPG